MKLESKARGARGMLGLTQAQLAAEVGVDRSEISRFENGRGRLPKKAKTRLLDLLSKKLQAAGFDLTLSDDEVVEVTEVTAQDGQAAQGVQGGSQ